MAKRFFFLFVVVLCNFTAKSQIITLDADNRPLNQVLVELRDTYHLRFSYDDNLLSQYLITAHKTFLSAENTVQFLLKDLPLNYDVAKEVFVIYPRIETKKASPGICLISGFILEENSEEPLAYSAIRMNRRSVATEINGYFSARIPYDSSIRITVSHLGYYLLDTLVKPSKNLRFHLRPASINLKAVEIKDFSID